MTDFSTIDNHTIMPDLLNAGSTVLDVGSRDYRFAMGIYEQIGCKIICLDPDPEVKEPPSNTGIKLIRAALVAERENPHKNLVLTGDPEARYLIDQNQATQWPQVPVHTITLGMIGYVNLIKLNCEGSEYEILREIDRPICDQVSFSMHEHTSFRQGKDKCDQILKHLEKWYKIVVGEWEARYCAGVSYWDVLAVRRELV
jgi:hypothetical protein